MNKLALGTVQFGLPYGIANQTGQITRLEAKSILQLASTSGIDILDTAIAYGDSETCLGALGVQDFKLVTKLPALPNNCADVNAWVKQQVRASITRLGVTGLYGLLLHRSEQLIGPNGTALYQALQSLKDNGQVQKIGVSIYSPSELEKLTQQYRFDLVQAPFNLVDRGLFNTGWLQRLKDNDVEIHARSVFLQGLLLMDKITRPAKFTQWNGLWDKWNQWLADHDVSAIQACLAFPLSFPEIDKVVVGADNVKQLAQIIRYAKQKSPIDFPKLQCADENLINPAHWPLL
jgi:aryl-alcohol dehydrogenase-like predicted oxidoreductase